MVVVLCTWLVWYVNSVVALLILDLLDFIVCSCFVRLVINAYDRLLIFMVASGFVAGFCGLFAGILLFGLYVGSWLSGLGLWLLWVVVCLIDLGGLRDWLVVWFGC